MLDGALVKPRKDLTGQKFGYLTAIRFSHMEKGRSKWYFRCECGKEVLRDSHDIKRQVKAGYLPSCGCKHREHFSKALTRHGMAATPIWNVWHSMKQRCTDPNAQAWKNYGGRGIKVCERWLEKFENFYADMGPTYKAGLTLDRIDVNGNYEPSNCRWITMRKQANNKRNNVRIGDLTIAEFARKHGLGVTTVYYRIKNGVPLEHLADPPDLSRKFSTLQTVDPGTDTSSKDQTENR